FRQAFPSGDRGQRLHAAGGHFFEPSPSARDGLEQHRIYLAANFACALRPKKSGPDQRLPVITRATSERESDALLRETAPPSPAPQPHGRRRPIGEPAQLPPPLCAPAASLSADGAL